jgi:hypothetical protein
MHSPLTWDKQYALFICHVGFLPLAQLVTALVGRWHAETHMFHLPYGETMMTLQDVTMVPGLPIDGTPICGMVSSVGWRDSVGEAIGIRPPDVPVDQKDKKTTGVHFRWLTTNFNTCSEGAENAIVQRYVLSCVWHMDNE